MLLTTHFYDNRPAGECLLVTTAGRALFVEPIPHMPAVDIFFRNVKFFLVQYFLPIVFFAVPLQVK